MRLELLRAEARRRPEKHAGTTAVLADLCETSQRGQSSSGDKMGSLVGQFADMLTLDQESLVTTVGMQKMLGAYLFDHCVNVAVLSMSIGAQLGMSREQILTVALGAVFQDVGMLRVPRTIRFAPREVSSEERGEIERHPICSVAYLDLIRGLPPAARLISYQISERINDSGYPRERSNLPPGILCMLAGCLTVYIALCGTGYRIYGDYVPAASLTTIVAVAAGALTKLRSRVATR